MVNKKKMKTTTALPAGVVAANTGVRKHMASLSNFLFRTHYRIELADVGDTDLVALLIDKLLRESFFPEDLPRPEEIQQTTEYLLSDGRYQAILAYSEDNQAVGVMTVVEGVSLRSKGRYGQIMGVYVSPEERSKGVGRALMDFLKDLARQNNWTRLEVLVPARGDPITAEQFFQRAGFASTGKALTIML
ncbi:MAG: GNAT family N-acetyltransferase [Hydrotalea sp.]|nr:GNAT family N-acetyltransferase [Hydrotalea sp.]